MARCTYDRAVYIASVYKKSIENAEYEINKDFNDMDLENNTIKQSIEEIVNEMLKECNNFCNEISSYTFR
ncbi:hypothetical protein L1S24_06400 [Clostridium sporogenes]|uniref:hypothetical protein n=1 Tax=Clostridium sporogenes TaxID=1509 RepID=UPI001F4701D8|nr:hypothetical protein [Clostridium sporogenes]MCF4016781.1 hypothetical protein [Clostridium sporogenes]